MWLSPEWARTALLFVCQLRHSACLSRTLGSCQCLQLRLKFHWVIAFWLASVDACRAGWPRGRCCRSSLSDDCSEHLLALKFTNRKQKLTRPFLKLLSGFALPGCFALPGSKSRNHLSFMPAFVFLGHPSSSLESRRWVSKHLRTKSAYVVHPRPGPRPSRTLLLKWR